MTSFNFCNPGCPLNDRLVLVAEKVQLYDSWCTWGWASKIPTGLDPIKCGPLMCGGVFPS